MSDMDAVTDESINELFCSINFYLIMPASTEAYESLTPEAVRHFWAARESAAAIQHARGNVDQGNRAGVTAGKNLDGFTTMVKQLISDNGISDFEIYTEKRADVTIPGFFRPMKNWDLLVVRKSQLIAAIEFKSQVGPSFGNNFNNRVEEAIGNAVDLKTAYREGVFGESPKPFVGYFFVLEECEKSMAPVRFKSNHFHAFPEFRETSYAARYDLLCRKLVLEQLYDAAALLLTSRTEGSFGRWRDMSESSSGRRFASTLAGKISGVAAE